MQCQWVVSRACAVLLYAAQEPTVQCTVPSTQQSSPSLVVLYPDLTTLNLSCQSPFTIHNEEEESTQIVTGRLRLLRVLRSGSPDLGPAPAINGLGPRSVPRGVPPPHTWLLTVISLQLDLIIGYNWFGQFRALN